VAQEIKIVQEVFMSAVTEATASSNPLRATSPPPSPQLFFETANAFQKTEALKAAVELELFTAIAEGRQTAEEIAARCNASTRGTRILCDFLVVNGLLTKQASHYSLTRDSAVFLDKRSPAYLGGALGFLLLPEQTEGFKHLAEAVRKGGTAIENHGIQPENPIWVEFAHSMAPMMTMPAELLARLLRAEEGKPSKVLSLAVGHGLYEATLALHNQSAEVWAVDWANVLEVARANAGKAGIGERFHTIPGSALDVEYGDNYDLALVVNFLHHFDIVTCEKLLRKVYASLKPGGQVVIVEFVPNEDRVSPAIPAAFSLIMLANTPQGDAYTFKQFQQMLMNSGFRTAELHPLAPTFFMVVIGTK
jgi:ubiquinone/menaquinone biosynthesis C-methylase UbiE/predicted transcriptional regulator